MKVRFGIQKSFKFKIYLFSPSNINVLTMCIFVCTLVARKEVVANAYQGTSGIFWQGVYGYRDRFGTSINVVNGAPEKVWIEMMVKKVVK